MASLSYFSLEVYIHDLEVKNEVMLMSDDVEGQQTKSGGFPRMPYAITFQFLDYPLLLCYASKCVNTPDARASYVFESGKSCMFQADSNELDFLVKQVPMYVSLMHVKSLPKPLLLATGSTPLFISPPPRPSATTTTSALPGLASAVVRQVTLFDSGGREWAQANLSCRLTLFGDQVPPASAINTQDMAKTRRTQRHNTTSAWDQPEAAPTPPTLFFAHRPQLYTQSLPRGTSAQQYQGSQTTAHLPQLYTQSLPQEGLAQQYQGTQSTALSGRMDGQRQVAWAADTSMTESEQQEGDVRKSAMQRSLELQQELERLHTSMHNQDQQAIHQHLHSNSNLNSNSAHSGLYASQGEGNTMPARSESQLRPASAHGPGRGATPGGYSSYTGQRKTVSAKAGVRSSDSTLRANTKTLDTTQALQGVKTKKKGAGQMSRSDSVQVRAALAAAKAIARSDGNSTNTLPLLQALLRYNTYSSKLDDFVKQAVQQTPPSTVKSSKTKLKPPIPAQSRAKASGKTKPQTKSQGIWDEASDNGENSYTDEGNKATVPRHLTDGEREDPSFDDMDDLVNTLRAKSPFKAAADASVPAQHPLGLGAKLVMSTALGAMSTQMTQVAQQIVGQSMFPMGGMGMMPAYNPNMMPPQAAKQAAQQGAAPMYPSMSGGFGSMVPNYPPMSGQNLWNMPQQYAPNVVPPEAPSQPQPSPKKSPDHKGVSWDDWEIKDEDGDDDDDDGVPDKSKFKAPSGLERTPTIKVMVGGKKELPAPPPPPPLQRQPTIVGGVEFIPPVFSPEPSSAGSSKSLQSNVSAGGWTKSNSIRRGSAAAKAAQEVAESYDYDDEDDFEDINDEPDISPAPTPKVLSRQSSASDRKDSNSSKQLLRTNSGSGAKLTKVESRRGTDKALPEIPEEREPSSHVPSENSSKPVRQSEMSAITVATDASSLFSSFSIGSDDDDNNSDNDFGDARRSAARSSRTQAVPQKDTKGAAKKPPRRSLTKSVSGMTDVSFLSSSSSGSEQLTSQNYSASKPKSQPPAPSTPGSVQQSSKCSVITASDLESEIDDDGFSNSMINSKQSIPPILPLIAFAVSHLTYFTHASATHCLRSQPPAASTRGSVQQSAKFSVITASDIESANDDDGFSGSIDFDEDEIVSGLDQPSLRHSMGGGGARGSRKDRVQESVDDPLGETADLLDEIAMMSSVESPIARDTRGYQRSYGGRY
eukprot:gene8184-1442_t